MTVLVHPDRLELREVPDGLTDILRVKHPAEHFIKKKNPHLREWDGFAKYYEKRGGVVTCGRGFLNRITDWASKNGERLSVDRTFKTYQFPPYTSAIRGQLDDEQEAPCRALLSNDFCVLELKTGSGKTVILANAIGCVLDADPTARVLFVVPKRNLMLQGIKEFRRFLPKYDVGAIGDGEFTCTGKTRVAVAVVNSAACNGTQVNAEAAREWIGGVNILALDECHRSGSDLWKAAINNCVNLQVMWAVSGKVTFSDPLKSMEIEAVIGKPFLTGRNASRECPVEVVAYRNSGWTGALDGMGLQSSLSDRCGVVIYLGDHVLEAEWRGSDQDGHIPGWMVERAKKLEAWLKQYDKSARMPASNCFGVYYGRTLLSESDDGTYGPFVDRDMMVFATTQDFGIVDYGKRNKWAADLAESLNAKGEPWAVSVRRSRHLGIISAMLDKRGVAHGAVHGGMSAKRQRNVFESVKAGTLMGFVGNADIIGEGVDIPNLVHIIRLDGMSGESILEQAKGRVQRTAPGKEKGYVHIPLDMHHKKLATNARKMLAYYKKIGLPITTRA
jgi:hypothetical protein